MFSRLAVLLLCTTQLFACAYNYEMEVPKDAPPAEYALITFHNTYKVSEIDGKKFSRKLSMWNDGSHTIKMRPGVHTFTVAYVSSTGAQAMTGWTHYHTISGPTVTLAANLEAGKSYEIVSDIGLSKDNTIRYKVIEIF